MGQIRRGSLISTNRKRYVLEKNGQLKSLMMPAQVSDPIPASPFPCPIRVCGPNPLVPLKRPSYAALEETNQIKKVSVTMPASCMHVSPLYLWSKRSPTPDMEARWHCKTPDLTSFFVHRYHFLRRRVLF